MSETSLPPTRVIVSCHEPDVRGAPTWAAFGDPDDHLRLIALIASHPGTLAAVHEVRDATELCLRPTTPWDRRLDAIGYLLGKQAPTNGAPRACLVDIDALDPGPIQAEVLWDDRGFVRQRRQFLDALLRAVTAGGWVLVRPKPSPGVTDALKEVPESDEIDAEPSAAGDPKLEALLDLVSPECRPLLVWLRTSETLSVREMERLVDAGGPEGFEEDVLDMVYEALPPSAQEAAKRLSSLRPPQPLNGALGPFHFTPGSGEPWLPRESVEALRACGLLQPFSGTHVRMPRAARDQLRALASRSMPEEIQGLHRRWGHAGSSSLPPDAALETHFHAVQGGDLDDALATAHYYVSDLRELAFRWSHDERHEDAARVYRAILDHDPDDTYAWEYLGYNLALACPEEEPSRERANEILAAYQKAFELDRKNPLYHGRLLGFRAQLGEDVELEFHRGMKRYLTDYDRTEAASYFAEPVLRGMARGRWGRKRFEIVERWAPALRRFPRLHPHLGQDIGSHTRALGDWPSTCLT
jgi:tetratricopeptide (TPR) repeat protein